MGFPRLLPALRATSVFATLLFAGGLQLPSTSASPMTAEALSVPPAFDEIEALISDTHPNLLSRGQKRSLLVKLEHAEGTLRHGRACLAAMGLEPFLHEVQALRRGMRAALAEDLYNRGRDLQQEVLALVPEGRRCSLRRHSASATTITTLRASSQELALRIAFADSQLKSLRNGDVLFTKVEVPGATARLGPVGDPAVPMLRRQVLIPPGAKVTLRARPRIGETIRMNLAPFETPPIDRALAASGAPQVGPDPLAAGTSTFARWPAAPCTFASQGHWRELEIGQLSCAAGQYEPASQTLRLFESIDVQIAFAGATVPRSPTPSLSPFDAWELRPSLNGRLMNGDLQHTIPHDPPQVADRGEELLILTHPSFRAAADSLKWWKRDKGVLTSVFEVNDGAAGPGPDTAEEIDAFIEERYTYLPVSPSYVLLIGDVEYVPTFQQPSNYEILVGKPTIGSDYEYALVGQADILPDIAVGRLPVQSEAAAQAAVNKIIRYESTPPTLASFYQNATVASLFECCRQDIAQEGTEKNPFIQGSELTRAWLGLNGYNVERIYQETVYDGCAGCDPPKPPYTGDPTPRRYYDGTPLTGDLDPANDFSWIDETADGDDAAVAAGLAAINGGRFLIVHRDHGAGWGWSHPPLNVAHLYPMTNADLLPVFLNADCMSGIFDQELFPQGYWGSFPSNGDSWGEGLVRKPNGGAVATLGCSRDSVGPTNDDITIGFITAVWPFTPYGPAVPPVRRLGDVLNSAKLYMLGAESVQGVAEDQAYIWNLLGDPTLEIWTSQPTALPDTYSMDVGTDSLEVAYARDGAVITAFQETEQGPNPVGRAVVSDGAAHIDYFAPPEPDRPVLLSVSAPNAVSRLLTPTLDPDQSNMVEASSSFGCGTPPGFLGSVFQSFTPSRPSLAAVDLVLRTGGDFPDEGILVTMRIRSDSPSGASLGEGTAWVPGGKPVGTRVTARFAPTSPLTVVPGQPYVIEWIAPGDAILTWMFASGNPYTAGQGFDCAASPTPDRDYLFTTYASR